jgi:soluble lytic murein transglycosylase-like protein
MGLRGSFARATVLRSALDGPRDRGDFRLHVDPARQSALAGNARPARHPRGRRNTQPIAPVGGFAKAVARPGTRDEDFAARYEVFSEHPIEPAYLGPDPWASDDRRFEPGLEALIRRTARRYRMAPHLVKAVVAAESNFDTLAVSHKGAQGLMQLMPATAKEMGVQSPFRPSENIQGGVRYLKTLLDRDDDLRVALAAYNAGPVAVDRFGGIPPYPETETYVKRVLRYYHKYREGDSQ